MRSDSSTSPAFLLIRIFLAPDNWLGFGESDFVVFSIAIAILLAAPLFPRVEWRVPKARSLAWAIVLAAIPIILRLAMLHRNPVPVPSGADDFGYILLADTLRHFRMSNPPQAFPEFFAQVFVLQHPTYSSMFNLGQGLALAAGWMLFGNPWAGVLLSTGGLCALCYWMLRASTTPGWALTGGLLAAIEFGPSCYWTNSYWGGAVSACAGCLVFGALPRLAHKSRKRHASLLGAGLAIQLLTRPFEFIFLVAAVLLFWPCIRRGAHLGRSVAIVSAILLSAGFVLLLQNKAVTGKWARTPYLLYRYQYGVPATFTFQSNPVPHADLNSEQGLDYRAEVAIHGDAPETIRKYLARLLLRGRFYRFFLLPPLYLAVAAFFFTIRTYQKIWVLFAIVLFAFGSNLYPYFYPHYIAAVTCLFILMSVNGLEQINRWRSPAGTLLMVLCLAQFTFWYSVRLFGNPRLTQQESWEFINPGDPQGRKVINTYIEHTPGKLLVFVHYARGHQFAEWIHNEANADASRVIWVHDLGDSKNRELQHHYSDRKPLLCEPDATPPSIAAYSVGSGPFEEVR